MGESAELSPRDLVGRTLRLTVPCASHYTIRWRVRSYAVGVVRLETVNSKRRSVTDWPELRAHIESGRIEVE